MSARRAKARVCVARLRVIVAASLGMCGVFGTDASAQVERSTQLRATLTAALEEYVSAFSDGRADFIADSVYMAPAYFLGGAGVDVRSTRDEVQTRFEDMMAPLPAQGYDRSDIRGSDVCVLNERAALVTLDFARVRRDGSVITEGRAIYLYVRTPEGWRINASLGSAPAIACG